MFNFFQSILDTLFVFVNYAVNFVQGLFNLVTSIISGTTYLVQSVLFLPVEIQAIALAIIGLAGFFKVFNRE